MSRVFRLAAPSDDAAAELIEQFCGEFGSPCHITIGGARLKEVSSKAEVTAALEGFELSRTHMLEFTCNATPAMQVHFRRGVSGENRDTYSPSAWEAEFYLRNSQAHSAIPPATDAIRAARIIENFRARQVTRPARRGPTSPPADELAALQLARLTELHVQITREAEEARIKAAALHEERTRQLESDWADKRRAGEEEFRARRAELDAQAAEVDAKAKDVDDRGHMHARRELRREISEALKRRLDKPTVSRQVGNLRLLILAATAGGIGLAAFYAFTSAFDLHDLMLPFGSAPEAPLNLLIIAAARFGLAAAVTAGLLFYLLGWLRQIHAEDVAAERSLERYRYDIDRASWAIETILEAQGKEGGTVPEEWIYGVTRSLFAGDQKTQDQNPLEALGTLLNVAARAEIGPNGPRIEFEKRGLRKVAAGSD